MHYTKGELRLRWIIATLAAIMFVFYSLVIIFFLYKAKHENAQDEEHGSSFKVKILGIIVSLFITVTNAILDMIVFELVKYMKSFSIAYFKSRYVAFSFLAKFVNTSLIAFLIQYFLYRDYFGSSGLFPSMVQLLAISGITSVVKSLFYVPIFKRFAMITLQKLLHSVSLEDASDFGHLKGYSPEADLHIHTLQGTLNKLYEYPIFPLETIYTSALNVVFSVMFFGWGSPFMSIIALVEFVCEQLLYRWHYSSLSSITNSINIDLSWEVSIYFDLALVAFAASNIIYPQIIGLPFNLGIVIA
jgi:hypothetical protein